MNKGKTPRIRFRGFTDDWEQRKLEDIVDICSGMDYKHLSFGNIPVYGTGGYMLSVNRALSYKDDAIGIGRKGTIDKPYILNAPFWTVDTLFYCIPRNKNCLDLVYDIFQLIDWKQKDESTGVPSLSKVAINDTDIMIPSIDEQQRIGAYFKNLDDLITLHQRKLEKLKIIKKSMLENCFPKNGEKVPKIRFSGFTGDWEQRKLGNVVERVTRKNENLESVLPLTISAQHGVIAQNEFFDKRIASKNISGYYLIRKGEFAYNKSTSSDAPWGAIKRLERYKNGVLSTLYLIFQIRDENRTDSDYLVTYYDANLWHKNIQEIAAEGARNHGLLNIAPEDFFRTKVSIPQNIDEQRKIGQYFQKLNQLITLHQRQLVLL